MNRTTLLLAISGILALSIVTNGLQRNRDPLESSLVDGVELTTASEQEAFAPGETVRIQFVLRNCTPKAIDLADSGPVFSYIIEVLNDQGRSVALTAQGAQLEEMRRSTSGHGLEIPPGETHADEVELSRWFELSKPGRYTVRAARRLFPTGYDDPVRLVSNILTITVLQ